MVHVMYFTFNHSGVFFLGGFGFFVVVGEELKERGFAFQ